MATLPPPQGAASLGIEQILQLALDHHRAGRREQAEPLYRQVLQSDPREANGLYLYGLLCAEDGRLDQAEALLNRFVAAHPGQAQAHVALANLHLRVGREQEAIAGFRRALAIQPQHPVALTGLAQIILERGFTDESDFDGAIAVCRSAIALLTEPGPAFGVLGRILLAAGRTAESVEAYQSAVALAPGNPIILAGLALAQLAAGDGEAALGAADQALVFGPDDPDALFARGSALLVLHRAREAAGVLEQAAMQAPDQPRMHIGLGDAYAELDRVREAVAHLSFAIELDPQSKTAHANLGSVLYRCGELDRAEGHLRQALAADPKMAVAHRNLAGILADRGKAGEARLHRDAAYGLQNLVVERAPPARASVLVLTTADSGNVPHKYLLPADRYTRIDWFIEYAHAGQAAQLPPYDLVFNIIGDPDYAGPTDAPVAAFLEHCDRPLINDPRRVGPTRRDRLPGLLADIEGLVLPRTIRLDAATDDLRDLPAAMAAAGLSAPVLIRPIGSHGGKGLVLAADDAELAAIDMSGADGAYATEFVDFRSPDDGLHRKYRMIFVDRTPYPYHLAVADDWLVHYVTANMLGAPERQAEEMRFLQDPAAAIGARALAAITAVGRRLDLDYAGIDFSVLPDGQVLVFEANATMLTHPEAPGELDGKNPYIARITDAFQALVDRKAGRH